MTDKLECDLPRSDVSRRGFFGKVSGCALGAAFLAGCESAELFTTSGIEEDTEFNTITHPGIAKTGGMAKLNTKGGVLVLVRKDKTTVLAYGALCPHQSCEMTPSSAGGVGMWDAKKSQLICLCHSSRFKTDGTFVTGSTLGGWDDPKPARTYKVQFDAASGAGKVLAG